MSLEARKVAEGEAHMAAAAKYMETSFLKLKFSPDWDSAADEYNKAAICFKVAKSWARCLDAHLKACEGYANSGSLFHAAKQMDNALLVCKENKDLGKVEDLASRGGLLYRQAGSPEAASQMLVRAAKLLELTMPENAIGLYEKASETVGTEDRPAEAAGHMETAAKLMVRTKQLDRAAECLHTTLQLYSEAGGGHGPGRVVLNLVLVQIARGDSVAADKIYKSWGGFCDGSQAGAANDVIQGFLNSDRADAERGLASPSIRSLDNDYVKLARDITLPRAQEDGEEELDLC